MTLAGSENYGGGVFNEVTYTSRGIIAPFVKNVTKMFKIRKKVRRAKKRPVAGGAGVMTNT